MENYICPNCGKNMTSFSFVCEGVECKSCNLEYANDRKTFIHLSDESHLLFYAVGTFNECYKQFKLKVFQ